MRVLFFDSNEVLSQFLPNGFRDAGHDILVSGPLSTCEQAEALVETFRPQLVVTNGWGEEQIPEKQHWIQEVVKRRRIPHVYWSVEDPLYTDYFVLPLLSVAKPDFVFTICRDKVDFFNSLGYPAAHLDWGFHPGIHYPTPPRPEYSVDIAMVANAYSWALDGLPLPRYRFEAMGILLKPLVENNIRVDIWGEGWEAMSPFVGAEIPPDWLHGRLSYTETNQVYSSAKIVIGLQAIPTQLSMRTYEVPAAAGFLLTVDTPAVRERFVSGRHLAVSASPEDTLRLVDYYLRHPEERQAIAWNGYYAVQEHTYRTRAEYVTETLRQAGILSGT